MAQTILHKAETRGHANHGWLSSYQSFSFAGYYNPDRMQFGALRVLNDDTVDAGMGFGKHPHDNMEIISIPLEGDLEHKDSMNNVAVIKNGDIQAMQITDIWEKLMGKTIAKYTDSIKIYGNKLYISTKVAPLKQELLFQKDNIILRVNEALKDNVIKEVIIN